MLRIPDAYEIGDDARIPLQPDRFDKNNNYRTKSVLCVPMRNYLGAIVGVIQLINRKPDFDMVLESPAQTEEVVSEFTEHDEHVLLSLARKPVSRSTTSSSSTRFKTSSSNSSRASVKAIEARDPATQGHSSRVAELTVAQAETLNTIEAGPLAELISSTPDASARDALRRAAARFRQGRRSRIHLRAKPRNCPTASSDMIRLRCLLAIEQLQMRAATP